MASTPESMASNSVFQSVRSAMLEYYTLLARMPHYASDSLELPPPGGWPGLDMEGLKALGRSDAAIEFVRHLPCLKPCLSCKRAWITQSSPALAYHRGSTWPAHWGTEPELGLWTPPHLFYLSDAVDARYGVCLILDTERGAIIEERKGDAGPLAADPVTQDNKMSWDQYEALSQAEKWTAHRATPATEFFAHQALRMQRLVEMPVPAVPRNSAEPRWYNRAQGSDEKYFLEIEDEWEADLEDDPEFMGADEPSIGHIQPDDDSEDNEEYEDLSVADEELQELAIETEEAERSGRPWNESSNLQIVEAPPELPAHTQHVYDCYKRHGWPRADFNVDRCRAELLDLQTEEEANAKAKTSSSQPLGKAWFEDRRQRMKKIRQAKGQEWDEEKEMSKSAEDWWNDYQQEKRQARDA